MTACCIRSSASCWASAPRHQRWVLHVVPWFLMFLSHSSTPQLCLLPSATRSGCLHHGGDLPSMSTTSSELVLCDSLQSEICLCSAGILLQFERRVVVSRQLHTSSSWLSIFCFLLPINVVPAASLLHRPSILPLICYVLITMCKNHI